MMINRRPQAFLARVVAALTLCAAAADAGAADAPQGNCNTAIHHEMDFWIGQWQVLHADGRVAGENRIVAVAGGCALYESWTGTGGITGHSLSFYDGQLRKWRQQWIDNTGTSLTLTGMKVGNSVLLLGESQELAGKLLQRITLTPGPDGGVRQLWETSADGGKLWKVEFDGRYVRK